MGSLSDRFYPNNLAAEIEPLSSITHSEELFSSGAPRTAPLSRSIQEWDERYPNMDGIPKKKLRFILMEESQPLQTSFLRPSHVRVDGPRMWYPFLHRAGWSPVSHTEWLLDIADLMFLRADLVRLRESAVDPCPCNPLCIQSQYSLRTLFEQAERAKVPKKGSTQSSFPTHCTKN